MGLYLFSVAVNQNKVTFVMYHTSQCVCSGGQKCLPDEGTCCMAPFCSWEKQFFFSSAADVTDVLINSDSLKKKN